MYVRIKRAVLFVAVLCLGAQAALSDDVQISSSVNATRISQSDQLTLTVTVTGTRNKLQLDPMPAFDITDTNKLTNIKVDNFQTMIIKTYSYTLRPKKPGTFKVGGASVRDGGKNYTTPAITVQVVKSTAPQVQPQLQSQLQSRAQAQSGKQTPSMGNENIFIKTSIDKDEAYVGEQVTFIFELYNRISIAETEYESPSTTGFWAVALPAIPKSTAMVNNRRYYHHVIKTALFPTMAGELTIGAASLDFTTNAGFFSRERSSRLTSEPLTLRVKSLPTKGKPADFNGVVGDFSIIADVDNTTVKVGEVVTIHVSVTGQGNLDLVTSITEPDLSAFRTYDPKVTETIGNSGFVASGAKSWDYVIISRQQGTVTIEPFSLSFFNPADEIYHTVATEPIELKVLAGAAIAFNGADDKSTRGDIEHLTSDIRYIKPEKTSLGSAERHVYARFYFYLLYIVPLAGFIAAFAVKKRRDTIELNTGLKRKLRAWKLAQKRLNEASVKLKAGDTTGFCGCLHESITGYVGDMLNLDTGALTARDLEEILKKNGIDEGLGELMRKKLEMCNFVRFAPVGTGRDAQEALLGEARDVITRLRDSL